MPEIKIFTEFGIGNKYLISTEVEKGTCEHRIRGCIRMRVIAVYCRLWIGKKVWLCSTKGGFVRMEKPKNRFKLLLGFEGVPVKSRS